MKKRILSLALAICMLAAFIPSAAITAFAATPRTSYELTVELFNKLIDDENVINSFYSDIRYTYVIALHTYLAKLEMVPFVRTEAPNLSDADGWAKPGIQEAYDKGFIPVDLQNNYMNVITRAEFCRMAVQWVEYRTGKSINAVIAGKGLIIRQDAFSDTKDPYILAAYTLGITSGTVAPTTTSSGMFTPDGEFNRQQAAVMIMNTCKVIGMDTANPPTSDFVDLNVADTWARAGINFVRANGIMGGTSTDPLKPMFSPKLTYTRQESIVTFNNIK